MSQLTSPSTASERPARIVYLSDMVAQPFVRMYRFSEHGGMTLHTHFGRFGTTRMDWVSMCVSDLIFIDIRRGDAAKALWAYRHSPSLIVTELRDK